VAIISAKLASQRTTLIQVRLAASKIDFFARSHGHGNIAIQSHVVGDEPRFLFDQYDHRSVGVLGRTHVFGTEPERIVDDRTGRD
jgi:hypothetical protein